MSIRLHRAARERSRDVEVHQVVRDLEGKVIADSIVHHIYTFDGEAISRMEVLTED